MAIVHHIALVQTPSGAMPVYVASPEGPGPHPAILVIQGMAGPASMEFLAAERLANNGFVGVTPDLFHRGPVCLTPDELQLRRRAMQNVDIIADIEATIEHLKQQSFIADRIGIMGFCMGGRVSYMMASRSPDIRAAVDCYGGGVFDHDGPGPTPFETTADINCPVLILDGELDEHPSPDQVRQIAAELEKFGKLHEVHIYPEVGHGFMSPGGRRSKPEVIEDAWSKIFDWFRQHVAAEAAVAQK
ncbi:MAG: dienelactone hydrolase family protein [Dehalococcoidia bacterium]